MELNIGEIFEDNGVWYQCIEGGCTCDGCAFQGDCEDVKCSRTTIFKKLEKVGEPFIYNGITIQRLKSLDADQCKYCYFGSRLCNPQLCGEKSFLVKLKQNKEDMEEKNNVKQTPLEKLVIDFFNNRISDIEFEKRVSELYAEHSNSEKIGKNLKEFDINLAKAGKPVCTRDGRKARIICFDAKFPKTGNIVALVEKENGEEVIFYYNNNGQANLSKDYDLMMLPEKKEGWVNVYKTNAHNILLSKNPYKTWKEAFDSRTKYQYVDTIKIEWEE